MPKNELSEYVKQVMKLKGLTQKDVQRLSGGKITDGYVASISIGRARNLSVDKLKALADGLGIQHDELFHVAGGVIEHVETTRDYTAEAVTILQNITKAVASPEITQLLDRVARLSPDDRDSLLAYIKKLGSDKRQKR